jgi:hypothetical protein
MRNSALELHGDPNKCTRRRQRAAAAWRLRFSRDSLVFGLHFEKIVVNGRKGFEIAPNKPKPLPEYPLYAASVLVARIATKRSLNVKESQPPLPILPTFL